MDLEFDRMTGDELRAEVAVISDEVEAGIRIRGQRYVHPGGFMDALAEAVRQRGGEIVLGADVLNAPSGTFAANLGDLALRTGAITAA